MIWAQRNSTFTPYLRKVIPVVTCLALFQWVATTLDHCESTNDSKPPRYAFATILMMENDLEFPHVEAPYLQAARLLTFQLLRNPRTRNMIDDVPFLILVTPDIPQRHRNLLNREGATVVPIENPDYDWGSSQRWDAVLGKLNLWKFEEYDKIVFLEVDSILFRPIYGIFEDPTTIVRATTNPTAKMPKNLYDRRTTRLSDGLESATRFRSGGLSGRSNG